MLWSKRKLTGYLIFNHLEMSTTFIQNDKSTSISSDSEGVARFESPHHEPVLVKIEDLEVAHQILDPCWLNGRDENLPESGFLIQSLQQVAMGLSVGAQQRIQIALIPLIVRIRLLGMHFDTSKCFLLPTAMEGIRRLCSIYEEHPQARVLVVGHTDTKGEETYNSTLSLERADSIGAFLTDKFDTWLNWYSDGKPYEKRWGTREDQHMLKTLPNEEKTYYAGEVNGIQDPLTVSAIKRFQADEGLQVDGIAGPKTRKALVMRYMALDGTTLPEGCELVTHGCGEYFPEQGTGDRQESKEDRRVEIFFFEGPIVPPPPGKTSARDSPEYPAWRAQVGQTVDVSQEGGPTVSASIRIWLLDIDGQRMPQTPFRLATPSGEIRTGYTDNEGCAEVYGFPWNTPCEVRWGMLEDAIYHLLPEDRVDAEDFFLYTDVILLGPDPESSDYIGQLMENLGYRGSDEECRLEFAADYGASDDTLIEEVHTTGKPKKLTSTQGGKQ